MKSNNKMPIENHKIYIHSKERSLTTYVHWANYLFCISIGIAIYTIFELRNDFHKSSATRKLINYEEEKRKNECTGM